MLERRIRENQGFKSNINITEKKSSVLNRDLHYIFNGKKIRKPGTMPKNIGNYERLAPTEYSNFILGLIRGYKEAGY